MSCSNASSLSGARLPGTNPKIRPSKIHVNIHLEAALDVASALMLFGFSGQSLVPFCFCPVMKLAHYQPSLGRSAPSNIKHHLGGALKFPEPLKLSPSGDVI